MNQTIYVENLNVESRPGDHCGDLFEVFAKYGTTGQVFVPVDFDTNCPLGFGFVDMKSGGDLAIASLQGTSLRGRSLQVSNSRHTFGEAIWRYGINHNGEWLSPWCPLEGMEEELAREVAAGHPLYGLSVRTLAHRMDCDDVLFQIEDGTGRVAVVHLTWTHNPPDVPPWPSLCFMIKENTVTTSEIMRRAENVYQRRWQATLEKTNMNSFVAIEPESEDCFLGRTLSEAAAAAAHSAYPNRQIAVLRVGHSVTVEIGGLCRDRNR